MGSLFVLARVALQPKGIVAVAAVAMAMTTETSRVVITELAAGPRRVDGRQRELRLSLQNTKLSPGRIQKHSLFIMVPH